jgi:hypothetical protein
VLRGIGTYVNLAGGHVYSEKVMASERKPIRIFMIDGRNDNRGVNADGQYDQTRDWFYQCGQSSMRTLARKIRPCRTPNLRSPSS